MKKRKIALVYDCIYPFIKGGGERRFYELGKRLVSKNTEVHLYGMKLWDGPNVIEREGLILHGIGKARPLYTKSGRRSIKQALLFGLSAFKLIGADFDVIDCCGFPYFSIFPCKIATLIYNKPLYATWHEVWGKDYWREYLGVLGYAGYLIERWASRLPNEITTVMGSVEDELRKELGVIQRVHIVANGIEVNRLRQLEPASEKSDVIFVGRLMKFKHVDVLLKAIVELRSKYPNIRCVIIGDGPELPNLKDLAKREKITKNVKFKGFIEDSEEVYRLIKASKVFVLPSTREGFGMVAVEAHACGLPVVTINDPGNAARHLIKQSVNGSVVLLDPDEIASSITKWLVTEEVDHTVHVRNFDWATIARKQEEIYSQ